MRLVYMDEAGISNRDHEPFVIVAGAIIDADKKLVAVERHIESLIKRHIPDAKQAGFVFHAKELFNGGGQVFKRDDPDWNFDRRLEIADQLAAIPKKFGLPVAIGLCERSRFPVSSAFEGGRWGTKDKSVAEHVMAFLSCSAEIEMWMRKQAPNEVCLLIVEDNQRARTLITTLQNTYQNPNTPIRTEMEALYFPFKKIKESPLFAGKRQSKALQIADFCAYVVKKAVMGNERYTRFMRPLVDCLVPSPEDALRRVQAGEKRAQSAPAPEV